MKTLLALVAVLAAAAAIATNRARRLSRAVHRIEAAGGSIGFNEQPSDEFGVAIGKTLPYDGTYRPSRLRLAYVDRITNARVIGDDDVLAEVQHCPDLLALDVDSEDVTDAGLKAITGLPHLRWLSLSCPKVTDKGLYHILSLRSLKTLRLARTQVTDAGVKVIAEMTSLRGVVYEETGVTAQGLYPLRRLPRLFFLWFPVEDVPEEQRLRLWELFPGVEGLHEIGLPDQTWSTNSSEQGQGDILLFCWSRTATQSERSVTRREGDSQRAG